jgi:hypothetical protein
MCSPPTARASQSSTPRSITGSCSRSPPPTKPRHRPSSRREPVLRVLRRCLPLVAGSRLRRVSPAPGNRRRPGHRRKWLLLPATRPPERSDYHRCEPAVGKEEFFLRRPPRPPRTTRSRGRPGRLCLREEEDALAAPRLAGWCAGGPVFRIAFSASGSRLRCRDRRRAGCGR